MAEIEEIVISVIQIGEGREESCYSRHSNVSTLKSIWDLKHLSQCFSFLSFIVLKKITIV